MNQLDFVGDLPSPKPPKLPGNTRPTVAEEKAALALQLGRLCQKPPPGVVNGGIELTRRWVQSQKDSLKVCKNTRASVFQLECALKVMRGFE